MLPGVLVVLFWLPSESAYHCKLNLLALCNKMTKPAGIRDQEWFLTLPERGMWPLRQCVFYHAVAHSVQQQLPEQVLSAHRHPAHSDHYLVSWIRVTMKSSKRR